MHPTPRPVIPWQVTGNHWLALPCIHPADGSLQMMGVLHHGARAAMEWAGAPDYLEGRSAPLLRPRIQLDGVERDLGERGLAWERALNWIPTFTSNLEQVVVRGTLFAPYGRDADLAGAVYVVALENRGEAAVRATVTMEGMLGHRQLRVRMPRPMDDAHRIDRGDDGEVVLEGSAQPGLAALALRADGESVVTVESGARPRFTITRELEVAAGAQESVALYLAAGPERDGAIATCDVLCRRGWAALLAQTRDALRHMEQTVGHDGIDRLINRNLLFAFFYGVGRALDDARHYFVRSRAPWNGRGLTVRDWEALSWTLPAVQLLDDGLARELLLRACELHGYAPGSGVHYLDGTMFEPGFSLEGAAAYPVAVDRYIRDTEDDQVVEEPVVADTLYGVWDDLAARRDEHVPLYATETTLGGLPAPLPYTLHGNAVVAQALDVLRRTLDEETARSVEDPEAVRAALRRHFAVERDGRVVFASAIDLGGHSSLDDDPDATAYWLPSYGAVERHDSVYRRTVRGVGTPPSALVLQCARLLGPEGGGVMQWLRRAPLDNGVAAELVDADGRVAGNGGDAALAGLLAWCLWYSVHALGHHV